MTPQQHRLKFRELHTGDGTFVMPNPWDVGSAKLLESLGFAALATTSLGFAWSLGRDDYGVTRDALVEHVRSIAKAINLPLNVDSEACFPHEHGGITTTVAMLHEAGASGCSIEDWDSTTGCVSPISRAAEAVAEAAEAAHSDTDSIVLTARCENLIRGITDIDDTIERLVAYRDAGADCVYAPGLSNVTDIRTVVQATEMPVNVLALPGGPTIAEIGQAGARRVSIGGSLSSTAYGALMAGARELLAEGTSSYLSTRLGPDDRTALNDRPPSS